MLSPRMARSSAVLWLPEATASMTCGGDDMARAHEFAPELGHFDRWVTAFEPCNIDRSYLLVPPSI